LFPTSDLTHLGLIPDPAFGWPVGFSRAKVSHLAGLSSVGLNCASCHVGEISSGNRTVRILGVTSHFDAEGFFGGLIVATFRTTDPANMKRFLAAYLTENDPTHGKKAEALFETQWQQQEQKIKSTMSSDPLGANDIASGGLHPIRSSDVRLD